MKEVNTFPHAGQVNSAGLTEVARTPAVRRNTTNLAARERNETEDLETEDSRLDAGRAREVEGQRGIMAFM
jgi:hypothetical protein